MTKNKVDFHEAVARYVSVSGTALLRLADIGLNPEAYGLPPDHPIVPLVLATIQTVEDVAEVSLIPITEELDRRMGVTTLMPKEFGYKGPTSDGIH